MAHRTAPKPAPFWAQKEAAAAAKAAGAANLLIADHQLSPLELLRHWILRHQSAAVKIAPRQQGRPTEWDMRLAAVQWLIERDITLSDATNSRCVQSLVEFMNDWRSRYPGQGKRKGPANRYTAAQLAGSLLECSRTTSWPPPA